MPTLSKSDTQQDDNAYEPDTTVHATNAYHRDVCSAGDLA